MYFIGHICMMQSELTSLYLNWEDSGELLVLPVEVTIHVI